MTWRERRTVEELAAALRQPVEGDAVAVSPANIRAGACEVIEDDDGNYDLTCHAVTVDVERFLHFEAAMAYLQALGVRDEN